MLSATIATAALSDEDILQADNICRAHRHHESPFLAKPQIEPYFWDDGFKEPCELIMARAREIYGRQAEAEREARKQRNAADLQTVSSLAHKLGSTP